jgi:hypothetical protein
LFHAVSRQNMQCQIEYSNQTVAIDPQNARHVRKPSLAGHLQKALVTARINRLTKPLRGFPGTPGLAPVFDGHTALPRPSRGVVQVQRQGFDRRVSAERGCPRQSAVPDS